MITGTNTSSKSIIKWYSDDLARKSGDWIATIRRLKLMTGVPSGNARINRCYSKSPRAGRRRIHRHPRSPTRCPS